MDSPLVYLTLCSLRNRLRFRLRRLREPRYLIGSIVGIGYWFLVFGRPFARRPRTGGVGLLNVIGHGETTVVIAAVGLLGIAALAWLWPGRRQPALAFTRSEVQFLFTAPIARRRLVRYRLVRSQLGAFFGSAILLLFMRPASLAQAGTLWAGLVLVMANVNVHLTGISLAVGAAGSLRHRVVRSWFPRAVVAIGVMVIGIDLAVRWPAGAGAAGGSVLSELVRLLSTGPSGVVLWPFAMLARLPLAESAAAFAKALPWALIVIGLNYVWIVHSDAPFEEASAELSEKLARIRTQGVSAVRRPKPGTTPFRLGADGPVEIALLWKNLISMGRVPWASLVRFIPALIVIALIASRGRAGGTRADGLAFLSLIVAAMVVWLGPQIARADLRQDLSNLAVLRTWPLRGATLVRGEVLAPGVVLVFLAWTALVVAAFFSMNGSARVQIPHLWASLTAALAVAPGLILLQLLVQNAIAVAFPSWVTVGRQRAGVDVVGQRMLMTFGSILALVVAALPAVLLAGIVFIAARSLTGGVPILPAGLVAAAVLLGEAFIGTELIGVLLERTDVSALDPSDA